MSLTFLRSMCCGLLLMLLSAEGRTKNYLEYFRRVAAAESELVEGHPREALTIYDSVFAEYEFSQPWDCYAAAQLAAYVGDHMRCLEMLKRGIVSGLPIATIRSNPRLASKLGPEALTQTVIDSCLQAYHAQINPKARREALLLARTDQRLIYDPTLTGGRSIYTRDGHTLKPELRPVWDSLLRELIRITETYGFPAERIIGTHAASDSLFPEGITTIYGWTLLVHHGRAWPQLQQMLYRELQRGNISPRLYGAIADHSDAATNNKAPYMALRSCSYFVKRKACEHDLTVRLPAINAARSAIGLCTYETMQQKEALKQAYRKWMKDGANGNPAVFDFVGVGWEAGVGK